MASASEARSKCLNIKIVKYDPPIKPRYLPGEIEPNLIQQDLRVYRHHRMRLANAKPVVDNKPPKLDFGVYYNYDKLDEDMRVAKINYRTNLMLARKLNAVYRMGGKVDCWNNSMRDYTNNRLSTRMDNKKIMRLNNVLYKKLKSLAISQFSPRVMAKNWKTMKEQIIEKSRYPWFKEISRYPSISALAKKVPANDVSIKRTNCYFDLELSDSNLPLGRVVFELYNDFVPLVCANFEAFCKGHNGLSYKGTPFHRILSDYRCQGGDVTKFNGIGGSSIYDDVSPDENFTLQHTCPGVLSTYSDKNTIIDSKFNLSFRPLNTMDGKKIVFGKVVQGMQNLLKINAYGTKFGKPLRRIIVANCGILKKCKSSRPTIQSKASEKSEKSEKSEN